MTNKVLYLGSLEWYVFQEMDFFLNTIFIMSLSIFIPASLVFYRLKPLWKERSTKYLSIFIILDLLQWFLSVILAYKGIYNIIISNIFSIFYFILIFMYFIELLNPKIKNALIIFIILYSIIKLLSIFYLNLYQHYSSYYDMINSILLLSMCIYFFFKIMKEHQIDNILSYQHFYYVSAILFLISASIIIIVFQNYFLKNMSAKANQIFWTFNSVINLLSYIIFAIGFHKCKPKAKY